MIKDATIVMLLGMGTVFLVLLALLGLMTLGGRLAVRFARPRGDNAPPCPTSGTAPGVDPAGSESQTRVAVAVAAAHQRCSREERDVSK